jgi:hypothetical protein
MLPLLEGATFPWWVAGGYAIEAFVGYPFRPHEDVDIALVRRDHLAARRHFGRWDLQCADPPGTLRRWPEGELLPPAVHDIWARESAADPWRFQLMLDESDRDSWVSRRDTAVRLPITDLTFERAGVSFLQPHVQLYYKSRSVRPKDQLDFDVVEPLLTGAQPCWLVERLRAADPGHPWLDRL